MFVNVTSIIIFENNTLLKRTANMLKEFIKM